MSLSQFALAATINIPGDRSSIQSGIDAASDGDIVLISPGTYYENLSLDGKTITLASWFFTTGNEEYIEQTVIDGENRSAVINVVNVGEETKIIGLTIQNGVDGISVYSKIHILNNHIIDNSDGIDYEDGGGICSGNLFENNSDDGIDLDGSVEATITNNIIRNNRDDGIEIRLHPYNGVLLGIIVSDNLISGNEEDGIQLIDYPEMSDRIFYIKRNVFISNAMAAIGVMEGGNTLEDLSGAPMPERVYLINNTFVAENYGVVGGANAIVLNNIFKDIQNSAMRRITGNSIASYNLFWNNGTNHEDTIIDLDNTHLIDPLLDSNHFLMENSPAIDAGTALFPWQGETVLSMPANSYAGIAPDLGAFEFLFDGSCDTYDAIETCDGYDNDCNEDTADGSGESWYGFSCDGPDADLCQEGVYECTIGLQICSDPLVDTFEICGDGMDNDCDGTVDETNIQESHVVSMYPVADASVNSERRSSNYGSDPELEVDGSPLKISYLRFDITGLSGTVQSARITLDVIDASSSGGTIHSISDNSWDENTITYDSRPDIDGPALDTLAEVAVGDSVELDVTAAINGDGIYSFALSPDSSNRAQYRSREDLTRPPVLIITIAEEGSPYYCDDDMDGHIDLTSDGTYYENGCAPENCQSVPGDDCDDSDPTIMPDTVEICDGIDNNCNTTVDEGFDADGDSYTTCGGDCDDNDTFAHPDQTWYEDSDGDGYSSGSIIIQCERPSGYKSESELSDSAVDCDDTNSAITIPGTWYADTDTDTYGDSNISTLACIQPPGYVSDNTDCNDSDPAINPDAIEVCDGIDNNCNDLIDDSDPGITGESTWYADTDTDTFGDTNISTLACTQPLGFVADNTDCNDSDPEINPGASEICDGKNNDCNTDTADGSGESWYLISCDGPDADLCQEGIYQCINGLQSCSDITGDIIEICSDGLDNDCDATVDEPNIPESYVVNILPVADTSVNSANQSGIYGLEPTLKIDGSPMRVGYIRFEITGLSGPAQSARIRLNVADQSSSGGTIHSISDNSWDENTVTYDTRPDIDGPALDTLGEVAVDDNIEFDVTAAIAGNGTYSFAIVSNDSNKVEYRSREDLTTPPVLILTINEEGFNLYCDDDGDGHIDLTSDGRFTGNGCIPSGCQTMPGDDCDDTDSVITTPDSWYADTDTDSYGNANSSVVACNQPVGYVSDDTDCNDNNSLINPGIIEICDGIDNNCNNSVDEGFDADEDTYTTCNGDCDDNDTLEHPDQIWYEDADGDGHSNGSVLVQCERPIFFKVESELAGISVDCNDSNPDIRPGAVEICDAIDNNCNDLIDDSDPGTTGQSTWYADTDTDTYGDTNISTLACTQPVGYVSDNTDCNDNNSSINPGIIEICDAIDNNCNDLIDDSDPSITGQSTWYADTDTDTFGDTNISTLACTQPVGYVSDNTDCNDNNSSINPGIIEICDGIDNNCNDLIDDSDPGITGQSTWYADTDTDTYGDTSTSLLSCTQPVGYVHDNTDCDDTNIAINPAATEVCDTIDNNCDGQIDEGVTTTYYQDSDIDTFGNLSVPTQACTPPVGYVIDNTDCDDANNTVHPGAADAICDGTDNNCDGTTDDEYISTTTNCGVGECASTGQLECQNGVEVDTCQEGTPQTEICGDTIDQDCNGSDLSCSDVDGDGDGFTPNQGDCDDVDPAINPAVTEVCDTIDNNCDGLIDDADPGVTGQSTWYADTDTDTFGDPLSSMLACTQPVGFVADNTDCNDNNLSINPDSIEICDGIDNDCNADTGDGSGESWYLVSCDGPDADLCEEGINECINGSQSCSDITGDIIEICSDSMDNDCDGTVDEPNIPDSSVVNVYPVADATVNSSNQSRTYGLEPTLEIRGSPMRISYIRFDIAGLSGPVQSARIRLDVTNRSPSGGTIHSISDNSWDENTINYDTRPDVDGPALDTLGEVAEGDSVEFDVTAAIAGNGSYSFAIVSNNTNKVEYRSREDLTNPPVLIISRSEEGFNFYCDDDGDGHIDSTSDGSYTGNGCLPSGCQALPGDDCNDSDGTIHPDATEICDGIDNECNSIIDDNCSP